MNHHPYYRKPLESPGEGSFFHPSMIESTGTRAGGCHPWRGAEQKCADADVNKTSDGRLKDLVSLPFHAVQQPPSLSARQPTGIRDTKEWCWSFLHSCCASLPADSWDAAGPHGFMRTRISFPLLPPWFVSGSIRRDSEFGVHLGSSMAVTSSRSRNSSPENLITRFLLSKSVQ